MSLEGLDSVDKVQELKNEGKLMLITPAEVKGIIVMIS